MRRHPWDARTGKPAVPQIKAGGPAHTSEMSGSLRRTRSSLSREVELDQGKGRDDVTTEAIKRRQKISQIRINAFTDAPLWRKRSRHAESFCRVQITSPHPNLQLKSHRVEKAPLYTDFSHWETITSCVTTGSCRRRSIRECPGMRFVFAPGEMCDGVGSKNGGFPDSDSHC